MTFQIRMKVIEIKKQYFWQIRILESYIKFLMGILSYVLINIGLCQFSKLYKIQKIMENGFPQTQHNKENNIQQIQNEDSKVLDELAPKVSIQDAFKRFQKEKFYQLKLNKFLKNVKVDRTSPEFKQQLRQKFIETAKKYIGVPYAQKYHKPGDELYSAPLFLDCCALIKQAVFDLRQQFGYTLGKWNQAYQFDLLPDQGLQQKDAKPGDLIFYSATYYDKRLKPFPHHMVHVQIYMGQGKSLGSRWQKGVIQVFDSYKFQSKLYHSIEYHFRSLDSWLEGKFQSHCKEHKWLDERNGQWLSEKFSVFADPSLDDMNITKTEGQPECRKYLIGKGNNNKLIKQYFKNLNTQNQSNSCGPSYLPIEQKDQFSPHFFYKWVQSPSQIDFYSFKEGEQIVNHIPNIMLVLASKLELLKTLQEFELDAENKGYPLTLKVDDFIPKTFRLDVMSDQISFIHHQSQGIWIYKPRNLNQGRGIKMIANIQQFKKEFIKSKKFYLGQYSLNNMLYYKPDLLKKQQTEPPSQPSSTSSQQQPPTQSKYKDLKQDGLIQQYIKPLLLDGRKFDIRCYMLINSNPNIVLFNQGYLRLTIQKYDEQNIEDENKLMIHLTNNCYQHKHKQYKNKKESSISKWDSLAKEIGEQKCNILKHEIKRILLYTYAAAAKKLMRKKGTYQLLGCDFLVDTNLRPYLLQINTNPALFTDTKVQTQIIPPLVTNSLNIILSLYDDYTQNQNNLLEIESNPSKYGFQIIYSQKSKIVYNGQVEKCVNEKNSMWYVNGLEIKKQGEKGEELGNL